MSAIYNKLLTYSYGDASLGVPRLLAGCGNGVEANKAVEAGGGSAQSSAQPKGEKTAGAATLFAAGRRYVKRPVGEAGLEEAESDDEADHAQVEEGEEVVEAGGLLHAHAQHGRQHQGDQEGRPVWNRVNQLGI